MTIFMLGGCGLVDLDLVSIPLGVFRTEEEGADAAHNIRPGVFRKGTITLYRTQFPGFFIGAIPIMKWGYETFFDESGIRRSKLSDFRIV